MSENPKTWTTAGPGRKMCSACGTYIGVRSKACPCGHVFEVKAPVLRSFSERANDRATSDGKKHESTQKAPDEDKRPVLHTPSGPCPVPLMGIGLSTVQIWMQELAQKHSAYQLAPGCFKFWARMYFPFGSEEYQTVCSHIQAYATFAKGD